MLVAVVEDDPIFAETLGQSLEDRGFRVDVIVTGAAALRRFERHDLDAAIVDMGLPDMDGVEVIARARETGMWAPILVATARVALDDMVRALEVGADDYVIKPCTGVEVAARLGLWAVERRPHVGPSWRAERSSSAPKTDTPWWTDAPSISPLDSARCSNCFCDAAARSCRAARYCQLLSGTSSTPERTSSTFTSATCGRSSRGAV